MIVQRGKCSGRQKCVGKSDLTKGWMNAGTHQNSGDGLSKTANDTVVLGNDNQTPGLPGLAQDGLGIKRLDRGDMQHSRVHMVWPIAATLR